MNTRTLATFASRVLVASLCVLAACGASRDEEDDGRNASGKSSGAITTSDGGADSGNPADNSTLGAPSVVGASPVQPSPWDHLITGASK